MTKKRGALLAGVTAVVIAAALIGWTMWRVGVDVEPTVESGYYDQFLFAQGTDLPALMMEATLDRYRVSPAGGESQGNAAVYDGAVLAPHLPNCAEMGEVRLDSREYIDIFYTPLAPEVCTQVQLTWDGGQTIRVAVTREDRDVLYGDVADPAFAAESDPAALAELAFSDAGGWADRGAYAALDPAALFTGELSARAAELDPACDDPLSSDLAFVLTDGEGMPPEEAAVLLLEELLEYYGQWREDCDFRIDAYAVGEQELLDRAALEAMAEGRQFWGLYQLRQEYPLLGEDMWCLTPEVQAAWTGYIYQPEGETRQPGELVDLSPMAPGADAVWVLIYDGEQYWLQRSEALVQLLSEE